MGDGGDAAYVELDITRLIAAVPLARDQFGEYVRQVARWLSAADGGAPTPAGAPDTVGL